MKNKIGLGMYTVHRTAQERLTETLCSLKEIGYRGIEFYGEFSDYPTGKVKEALGTSGLSITSWHVEWRNLQDELLGETVRYLHEVGCRTAIVPCLGGKWNVGHESSEEREDIWLSYIERMNKLHHVLKGEGIRLGYHNHEHEFILNYQGTTVFDLLFDNLDVEIIMEFDSGNCIEGGKNPYDILHRHCNRPVILHLKPYSHLKGFDVVLGEDDDNDIESLLYHADCTFEWLLLESENSKLPEMENAKRCFINLVKYMK